MRGWKESGALDTFARARARVKELLAEQLAVDAAKVTPDGLVTFARDHALDLVVVGPEAPLVAGLVDRLEAAGS